MSFNNQNKKSAYVPPSMRTQKSSPAQQNAQQPTSIKPTKKKEPKKEFSLADAGAFPSLGVNKWNSCLPNGIIQTNTVNFSAAAATKKIEELIKPKIEVLPGWVHIRKQDGKIQYKYGAPIPYDYNAAERRDIALGNQLFKFMLERSQYERDMDVLRLGDLSEFYNKPSLAEIFEKDVVAAYDLEDAGSDYDDSINSEDEY